MTLSFRQVVYLIILLGSLALSVALCSKHLIVPIVSQEPAPQEELLFKESQEERIKDNVSVLLRKLVGKNTFFVSVMVDFNDVVIERESVKNTPTMVTENRTMALYETRDVLKRLVLNQRPTAERLRDILKQAPLGKLPGLINETVVTQDIKPLPGFPTLTRKEVLPPVKDDTRYSENKLPLTPGVEPHDTEKYALNTTHTDNVVVFDQETKKTSTPRTYVDKVFVSVVIDEDHFKLLNLEPSRLKALVGSVAALDTRRGDELVIAYLPFVEKSFDFNRFMLKNKTFIESTKSMLKRFRWGILATILVIIAGVLSFYLFRWVKYLLLQRRERIAEEKRLAEEAAADKEQQVVDEIEEKRQAVLNLAKSKPEDFSSLILNWLEAADNESEAS